MGSVSRGKIVRDDLALFGGISKTYTRDSLTETVSSSGDSWDGAWGESYGDSWGDQSSTSSATITKLTIGDSVDLLQVFGEGDMRTVATIQAALDRIGTSRNLTLLYSSGTWVIDSDLTIPANLANRIPGGCVFAVSSGVTLTFAGPVHVDYSTSTGTGWYSGTVVCSVGAYGFPGW